MLPRARACYAIFAVYSSPLTPPDAPPPLACLRAIAASFLRFCRYDCHYCRRCHRAALPLIFSMLLMSPGFRRLLPLPYYAAATPLPRRRRRHTLIIFAITPLFIADVFFCMRAYAILCLMLLALMLHATLPPLTMPCARADALLFRLMPPTLPCLR